MNKTSLQAIQEHARRQYPRECCGVLVATGRKIRYQPCRNIAHDKDDFCIHPEDFAAAEDIGEIIGIVHSHPDYSNKPSESDRVGCEQSRIPWYILSVYKDRVDDIINKVDPTGYKAPLLGRSFFHGTLDCYTLIRDFYNREMRIELPDFERANKWWENGQNLYMDNFAKAGFRRLKDEEAKALQFGDVILMQMYTSTVANHAGVFLGDVKEIDGKPVYPVHNAMIHHMYGYASERVIYGGMWANSTVAVLRYVK